MKDVTIARPCKRSHPPDQNRLCVEPVEKLSPSDEYVPYLEEKFNSYDYIGTVKRLASIRPSTRHSPSHGYCEARSLEPSHRASTRLLVAYILPFEYEDQIFINVPAVVAAMF